MSTVADIAQVIPRLSNEDLRAVEKLVLQTYRERKVGIIFDDGYGTFTEDDLAAIQEDALRAIDGEPPRP
jgi:hypothetical protein